MKLFRVIFDIEIAPNTVHRIYWYPAHKEFYLVIRKTFPVNTPETLLRKGKTYVDITIDIAQAIVEKNRQQILSRIRNRLTNHHASK